MQYSGIVVTVSPATLHETVTRLNALPGVEVHQTDTDRGKIVAVLEGEALEEHGNMLRDISELPGVLTADLACHVADPDDPEERTP
ncbi:MAG: chaperone NapD [Planctomycetota bacterium]